MQGVAINIGSSKLATGMLVGESMVVLAPEVSGAMVQGRWFRGDGRGLRNELSPLSRQGHPLCHGSSHHRPPPHPSEH